MISYLREGLAVSLAGRDRQICLLDGGPTLIGLGCCQLSGKAGSIGKNLHRWPSARSMLFYAAMGHKTADYEKILRAIGQGLEALSVEAFDLELANDLFMIQATAVRSRATKLNAPKLGGIRKAFLKICSSSKKRSSPQIPADKLSGAPVLLSLQFTRTDIDNLEREGQALRSDWKGSPLAHSLPQVLRTVGVC